MPAGPNFQFSQEMMVQYIEIDEHVIHSTTGFKVTPEDKKSASRAEQTKYGIRAQPGQSESRGPGQNQQEYTDSFTPASGPQFLRTL